MDLSTQTLPRQALYYPFHLCHERTLARLLQDYASVHFRDYMALQLTPMSGTTAYQDRMGQYFPDLVQTGRIVQGYPVSGPLDAEMAAAIDRDLADQVWRARFHADLRNDRRFQRGLFDLSHRFTIGNSTVPGPQALLRLLEEAHLQRTYTVAYIQTLSHDSSSPDTAYEYEYGLALIKTSAALVYTIRLCHQHGLDAVTDSEAHFRLLAQSCVRDTIALQNRWLDSEKD